MAKIIDLMKTIHIPVKINTEGVCWGIVMRAEKARRLGEYDKFKARMDYLAGIEVDDFVSRMKVRKIQSINAEILEAKRKLEAGEKLTPQEVEWANRKPKKLTTPLSKEEMLILEEVEAYFFQIWAYYRPQAIRKFLEPGSSLSQHDFRKLEELMFEDLPLPSPHSYFIHTSPGIADSITPFLDEIQRSGESVGIAIGSTEHAVHLFYDKQKNAWMLTNHSELREFLSIQELVPELIDRFTMGKSKIINLNFSLFTADPPNQNTHILLAELKKISNASVANVSQSKMLNKSDVDGTTPLSFAAGKNLEDVVDVLLKADNIKVNHSMDKETPLWSAARHGHLGIVNALLEHSKIEVNKAYKANGETALWRAAHNGHVEVVKALLKAENIEMDKPNNNGNTPLWVAVKRGHINVVEAFLEAKSEVDKRRDRNQYPHLILLAQKKGHFKIAEALLEKGDFMLLELIKEKNVKLDDLWKYWQDQASDEKQAPRRQTSELIPVLANSKLKNDIIQYVNEKKNSLADQHKKAFFIEIIALIANDRLSLDNLLHKLIKFEQMQNNGLFAGGISQKPSDSSKAAQLVNALFQEIGVSLQPDQLQSIVNGQTQLIQERLKKDALQVMTEAWRTNPSGAGHFLEHEIKGLVGLNSNENRFLSVATALFNAYQGKLHREDEKASFREKLHLIQKVSPIFFHALLAKLDRKFADDKEYKRASGPFRSDKSLVSSLGVFGHEEKEEKVRMVLPANATQKTRQTPTSRAPKS